MIVINKITAIISSRRNKRINRAAFKSWIIDYREYKHNKREEEWNKTLKVYHSMSISG